jgi:hypothetical protein
MSVVHAVRVHDPGHHARIRAEVRRRDVHLRADDYADLGGISAGEPLKLAFRQAARVDDNATLGAAVRQVDHGAFPCHPHRQRLHLVEANEGAVADAAFHGPAGVVVLHPVAREHLGVAVVHADGEVDGQLAPAQLEDLEEVRVQVQQPGNFS